MSYSVSTRAEHRDQVRRLLGYIPPVDDNVGVPGEVPTVNPWPDNPFLDVAIDDTVAWMSRKVKVAGDAAPILYPVPSQTANGPYQITLQQIAPLGVVNDVRRVAWLQDNQNEQTLRRWNREEVDRDRLSGFMTQVPGAPEAYWVEFGKLSLWPAPQTAGTLSIMFGKSLWSQAQTIDDEIVEIIPSDYWPIIDYRTALLVCLQQPEDMVEAPRAAMIQQMLNEILPEFESWVRRQSRMQEASMVPLTGRTGFYGGRR